jgi:hypothetical protein
LHNCFFRLVDTRGFNLFDLGEIDEFKTIMNGFLRDADIIERDIGMDGEFIVNIDSYDFCRGRETESD